MTGDPGAGTERRPETPGRELLAVAALMTLLTAAMLFPYVRHPRSVPELGDPLFSIWRMAWVAHQVREAPARLYDANIFHPERYTLAHSDGMPLIGLAAAPFIWLGAPPVLVYTAFVLLSFVLSGVTMFLLVRSLVGRPGPAVVSAVAFAFAPFRYEHLIHIELLSAFWMPLALWALHQTLTVHGRRWWTGPLAGAALAAQYLSGMYFGIYLAAVMFAIWAVLAAARSHPASATLPLVAGMLLASALILPSLPPYVHIRQAAGDRPMAEVRMFSARPADYLAVQHPNRRLGGCNERQVFPGFLVVALAAAALWPPLSAVRLAYLAGLALAFDLSLGSNGLTHSLLWTWVLPFRGLRAPARSAMLVALALSVLAGFGTARLTGLLRSRRWRAALAGAFCGVILLEPRPARDTTPVPELPPIYATLAQQPPGVLAETPMWWGISDRYLYFSTTHWRPMVNGFSGSLPPSYRPLHVAMRTFPDAASLVMLRSYGVRYVIVHEEYYETERYRPVVEKADRAPALALIGAASDGRFESRLYRLER